MLNRLLYLFILLVAFALTSCSKDDEGGQQPAPVPVPTPDTLTVEGAKLQVMVVFAPGQLGDQGYADNLMEGVVQMQQQQKNGGIDSINVEFIALYTFDDLRQRLRAWAAQPANPYYKHDYERRLLVLTEPYMAQWVSDISNLLRPTDEVLLLRAAEGEVQEVAAASALDRRLHGLKIDVAPSIQYWATYVKKNLKDWHIIYDANNDENEDENEDECADDNGDEYEDGYDDDWGDDWDDWDDWDDDDDEPMVPIPDHVRVYIYRQYEPTVVKYGDGMEELLRQELGPEAEIISLYVDNWLDDGYYTEGSKNNYLETVYQKIQQISQQCWEEGLGYVIFDLGVWNNSAIRFMKTSPLSIDVLMIDVYSEYTLPRSYMLMRDYSRALQEWIFDWCRQPAATMPQNRTLGDGYVIHDIPSHGEL